MFTTKVLMFFATVGIVHCEVKNFQFRSSKLMLNLSKSIRNKFDKAQESESNTTQIMRLLKEKCDKNGGSYSYTRAESTLAVASDCYYANAGSDLGGLEDSDDVVKRATAKRFCSHTLQMELCFGTVLAALRPCLAADETPHLDNVKDALHRFFEFLCLNEGEKMIEFYSEEALACRSSQEDAVNACLDRTIHPFRLFEIDTTGVTADDLVQRLFAGERCSKLRALRTCVVAAYRQCQQPVSADIIDPVLNIMLEGTPCDASVQAKP